MHFIESIIISSIFPNNWFWHMIFTQFWLLTQWNTIFHVLQNPSLQIGLLVNLWNKKVLVRKLFFNKKKEDK